MYHLDPRAILERKIVQIVITSFLLNFGIQKQTLNWNTRSWFFSILLHFCHFLSFQFLCFLSTFRHHQSYLRATTLHLNRHSVVFFFYFQFNLFKLLAYQITFTQLFTDSYTDNLVNLKLLPCLFFSSLLNQTRTYYFQGLDTLLTDNLPGYFCQQPQVILDACFATFPSFILNQFH